MGKETKIGLAVIGVLLSVFGVLLFRHLSVSRPVKRDHELRGPAEPLAAEPAGGKPTVVMAQNDRAGRSIDESLWGAGGSQSPARSEVPAASYMPAESQPAADPYATDHPTPEPANPPAERSAGASPFQNRAPVTAAAGEGRFDPPPPAELPREDSSEQARRNPLRRLSAELPLNAPQQSDAAADDGSADETVDPYAGGEQPAQPAALDASETPGGAPQPAVPSDSGPQGIAESADDDRAQPFPEDDARGPLPDVARSDPFPDAFGDRSSPAPVANDQPPLQSLPDSRLPPGADEPLPIENGVYTVQPNDTLWSISEKVYGTGGYFKALAAHNRSSLPRSDRLSVGMQVAVPGIEELERNYPSLCPKPRKSALVSPRPAANLAPARHASSGDAYVVEEGDTLFDIARYELGKASRWAEIYQLNRDKLGEDFDYLQPGIELQMPQRAADTIGRGGDSGYLR
jgi:nucleoid-associated protein YgaU